MREALLACMLVASACSGGSGVEETGDTGWVDTDVPCYPQGAPRLDVGEGGEGWGIDDIEVVVGIPPQGGAPYARFRVRVANVDLSDGADVSVHLYDEDDERIGAVDVVSGFVCANVGDNVDHWVTPEVHARFDGYDLLDLHEVPVTMEATVVGVEESVFLAGDGMLMVDDRFEELL